MQESSDVIMIGHEYRGLPHDLLAGGMVFLPVRDSRLVVTSNS